MPTANRLSKATTSVFKLLEGLPPDDRQRILAAALTLFGDQGPNPSAVQGGVVSQTFAMLGAAPKGSLSAADARSYFDQKVPQSKIEELAVAARFREQLKGAATHEKSDLEDVIRAARRSFNGDKYRRDMDNAKTAGFFNRGNGNPLSHYGQDFVDALPDRDAAKALPKPKAAGRRRGSTKVVSKGQKSTSKASK